MEAEGARGTKVEVNNADPVEMKSPPVQTMDGYDPNRIPSSIFSSSQGDWSSESLFSIQMGNNSFSKDYAILYGDLDSNPSQSHPFKSGELPRLDDWSNRSNPSSFTPGSADLSTNQSPAAAKPNPRLRLSEDSGNSNQSFAFPVLVSDSGKTNYSTKVVPEKPVSGPQKEAEKPPNVEATVPLPPPPRPQQQSQHKVGVHPPKRWFSCFSCSWPRFC